MDFESPDVMKDFPGLYASELSKKCSNDSDCKYIYILIKNVFVTQFQ